MSQNPLQPYADVVVVNNQKAALGLSLGLKKEPQSTVLKSFASIRGAGSIVMYRNPAYPGMVYECIAAPEEGDAVASVYMDHRIFNSIGELVKARLALVKAVAEKIGMSSSLVGIEDPARGRSIYLTECSTGQLIDMLAEKMGKSVSVTNSHIVTQV